MECPICLDIYESPVLLPGCGHTLCKCCAQSIITEGNFLRCPECRLVYQLRQGIKSLPRNVALQRTIDEHAKSPGRTTVKCIDHPDDTAALYCKTCEKSICLKCYFTNNTLRRGQQTHVGHQVDTSEDAYTKEKRLLERLRKICAEEKTEEMEYVHSLEKTEGMLKTTLDEKTEEIEKKKNDIISNVKQTANKLKFTLKGSMVRDSEYLQMSLKSSKERLDNLVALLEQTDVILAQAVDEQLEVNTLKDTRKKLEEFRDTLHCERPQADSFMKIASFDTDVISCLGDQKKALSYQTESPKATSICQAECVISDKSAYIVANYDEQVRVKSVTFHYKEALYKGMSEKLWSVFVIEDVSCGKACGVVKNLKPGTMYRMFSTATNEHGVSHPSPELWFRTFDGETEMRVT